MIEAIQQISLLERRVMARLRWLAFQHTAALIGLFAGLASAAAILYIRLRASDFPWGVAVAAIFALVSGVLFTRWFLSRANERDAAFAIDRQLDLEDRISTVRAIMERGGPARAVEHALAEDAADRIKTARASMIVSYSFSRWHALGVAAVFAMVVTVMIPEKHSPAVQEVTEERAEIRSAGEQLEQSSTEIERIAPLGSETSRLAREQAELGGALRRSNDTRAEALRKLSAIEDRIRRRHDELASTRADEVVALADRRLRPAVAARPGDEREIARAASGPEELRAAPGQPRASEDGGSKVPDAQLKASDVRKDTPEAAGKREGKERSVKTPEKSENAPGDQQPADKEHARSPGERDSGATKDESKKGAQPAPANEQPAATSKSEIERQDGVSKPEAKQAPPAGVDEAARASGEKAADKRTEEKGLNLPGAIAEQAAKALPGLSEQLLKKAEQLRANELKPEDIRKLQQAAQLLARDLAQIAQSKELQQAVEELARQIKPEQLEEVARALASQEALKRELESAARLMMENQQVKQMVAGLAQQFAQQRDQLRPQQAGARAPGSATRAGAKGSGPDDSSSRRPSAASRFERAFGREKMAGRGKEETLSGKFQTGTGGAYLYLQAKPGVGASRATYSSAYPKYRREAERSVERSQVPPRMRSVVRDYFDAINPDVKRTR